MPHPMTDNQSRIIWPRQQDEKNGNGRVNFDCDIRIEPQPLEENVERQISPDCEGNFCNPNALGQFGDIEDDLLFHLCTHMEF